MIIKKNTYKSNIIKTIQKLLNKVIFFIGVITLVITIFFIGYYYNSGMHENYKPYELVKKIDKIILDKYLGISIFEIGDYLNLKLTSLKYLFIKNDFDNVVINIDQKNLYNLELQRKNRINRSLQKIENRL